MSLLDGVMREEYDRINRVIHSIEMEISELPKSMKDDLKKLERVLR